MVWDSPPPLTAPPPLCTHIWALSPPLPCVTTPVLMQQWLGAEGFSPLFPWSPLAAVTGSYLEQEQAVYEQLRSLVMQVQST